MSMDILITCIIYLSMAFNIFIFCYIGETVTEQVKYKKNLYKMKILMQYSRVFIN